MSANRLQPETIFFRLGDRLTHSIDSYEENGANRGDINLHRRGYKPTWLSEALRQRVVANSPTGTVC